MSACSASSRTRAFTLALLLTALTVPAISGAKVTLGSGSDSGRSVSRITISGSARANRADAPSPSPSQTPSA